MIPKLGRFFRIHGTVLKESFQSYFARHTMTQAAAMAYYMVFSLPPILFIVLWTAARFYQEAQMREAISEEFSDLVGRDGAGQLMATIERLDIQDPTVGVTVVGVGVMLFTATTIMITAHNALNRIADVAPVGGDHGGVWKMILSRVASSAMLVTVAIILLVSMVIETLVAAFGRVVAEWHPGIGDFLMAFDSLLMDLGATTVLVALFFRYLPDTRLPWRDIWPGALVTALMFTGGRTVIGIIIGRSQAADLYAAAGSLLVMMLWVYYASALFLFGATWTFTRARLLGHWSPDTEESS